ncbi:MAG: type II secretion system protein [Ruminococcus sp.]|nr:type II secretion system protein [Ruminococcus sp.]
MKKVNKNGMTLVEVIISMAILSCIAAMFVTIAVSAKNKNAETYIRGNEMYEQAAAAEAFNTKTDYGSHCKISKLMASATDNNFNIIADFGTITLKNKAYGFEVKRRGLDKKDQNYHLRFFRSENASTIVPNPDAGEFCIKIYNNSGVEQHLTLSAACGRFFNDKNKSEGDHPSFFVANDDKNEIGYAAGDDSELFRVCNWEDESVVYYTFNEVNLANFMEIKDGKVTGNVIIHICDGLQFKNQAEYEAETGV